MVKEPELCHYTFSMEGLGIPYTECERIDSFLKDGKFPPNVIDKVIEDEEKIAELHPDQYPWHPSVSDDIAKGISNAKIDSKKAWEQATEYVKNKYNREMPSSCSIDVSTTEALTNLLERYALIQYHDIEKLKHKKK